MSTVAKSAFIGYTYQFQVALLAVFFLEEKLYDISQVIPEIDEIEHNFDDIMCIRDNPKKDLYIQVKNSEKNHFRFEDDNIYFNSQAITTRKHAINIIVTRNENNLNKNYEKNGLKFYMNDEKDLIVIHLPSEEISEYIFSKFHPSRINQILSLALKKFTNYYDCKIDSSELPNVEFMSSDLLEKTFLIRNMQIEFDNNILFIVGKPGVGKSHLVNELNAQDNRLYRFWVSNLDPDRISRLNFSSFLYQLSLKLFGSGRLRSECEIIEMISNINDIFYIDGLDHVENYNPSELSLYFDFIKKVSDRKNGKIIILTRPLHHEINYPSIQLHDWSFDETREYLNYRGISDFSICQDIYKITKGYPIITGYICSEWLQKNGEISLSNPVSSLYEYYSIVISNVKFKNKMSLFTFSSTFYLVDEIEKILGSSMSDLMEFIKYYPFLFDIENDRIALIHDSFNNYINTQIEFENDIYLRLVDYVETSLMNEEPRFMARVLTYNLSNGFLSKLLHKYSSIDTFVRLKNSILDYESVKKLYYSLRKIYSIQESDLLSPEESYELSMIYTILMRDNVEQSYGLMYQFFVYLQKNSVEWKKVIFSSDSIYNAFSYFDGNDIDSLYKIETDKGYDRESILESIDNQLVYEVNFFKTYEVDNYDKYKYDVTHNNEFHASNSLTKMLVSAYLFDHDEDGMKSIVQKYIDGNYDTASYILAKFLTDNGWKYTRPYSNNNIYDAKNIILQLGTNNMPNDYINLTLKEVIKKYASGGSFELNNIVNGYIRLANYQGRKIDIQSLTHYLPLYYEHKDYSIVGLSEIFYELISRDKIKIDYAFNIIKSFQNMSDKGIRHLCNDLVNLLGPNYVNDMEKLGIISYPSNYNISITELSADIINVLNPNYVEEVIREVVYNEMNIRYVYKDKIELKEENYKTIIQSKYSELFKELLKRNSIELVEETQSLKTSELEIIANGTETPESRRINHFDEGILVASDIEYYKQINLDFITFSRFGGGWFEKLPYPDFLGLYDKKVLRDNINLILQNTISKSYVGMRYDDDRIENGTDRGLMSGIPRLLAYVEYDIDWEFIKNAVIKMIDVSLGIL